MKDIDKLQKLKEKKQKLENRIRLEENRLNHKQRQIDTRKKILVGAYYLSKFANNPEVITNELDHYLDRPQDRELFGLSLTKIITNE